MSDDHPPLTPPGSTPDGPQPAAPSTWGGSAPPPGIPPAPPPARSPAHSPAAPPAAPGFGQPLHKPGTVPLRPLLLSDFFDGAFSTVRRNPRATVGMAALVTAGFMLIPIAGSLLAGLGGLLDGALQPDASGTSIENEAGTIAVYAVSSLSSIFSLFAAVVVTGLVVPVVTRATVGERLSVGEAWRQVRRRLPALFGLALVEFLVALLILGASIGAGALVGYAASGVVLAVVLGLAGLLVGLLALIAVHMRWFQLAAPALVVERRGVFASLARAGRLSHGQFWRITGITILVQVVAYLVGQIVSVPFGVLGAFAGFVIPDPFGPIVLLVASNLAAIVTGAVITPFTASVAVLQYLDQRFRKEGFDLDLITYVQRRQGGDQAPGQAR